MATVYELDVQIGNTLSFPKKNPHEYGYDPKDIHVAKIVGPASFPKSYEVYLAPPGPFGGNIFIYNPQTDKRRSAIDIDHSTYPRVTNPSPLQEGEILIQSIHNGYTLFERA